TGHSEGSFATPRVSAVVSETTGEGEAGGQLIGDSDVHCVRGSKVLHRDAVTALASGNKLVGCDGFGECQVRFGIDVRHRHGVGVVGSARHGGFRSSGCHRGGVDHG